MVASLLAVASGDVGGQTTLASATVFGEVAQELVHGVKRCAVNQVAPLALLGHESGLHQFLQMERQESRCHAKLLQDDTWRQPVLARYHQGAKDPQANFLR